MAVPTIDDVSNPGGTGVVGDGFLADTFDRADENPLGGVLGWYSGITPNARLGVYTNYWSPTNPYGVGPVMQVVSNQCRAVGGYSAMIGPNGVSTGYGTSVLAGHTGQEAIVDLPVYTGELWFIHLCTSGPKSLLGGVVSGTIWLGGHDAAAFTRLDDGTTADTFAAGDRAWLDYDADADTLTIYRQAGGIADHTAAWTVLKSVTVGLYGDILRPGGGAGLESASTAGTAFDNFRFGPSWWSETPYVPPADEFDSQWVEGFLRVGENYTSDDNPIPGSIITVYQEDAEGPYHWREGFLRDYFERLIIYRPPCPEP